MNALHCGHYALKQGTGYLFLMQIPAGFSAKIFSKLIESDGDSTWSIYFFV
jgi:hypothetical protein